MKNMEKKERGELVMTMREEEEEAEKDILWNSREK